MAFAAVLVREDLRPVAVRVAVDVPLEAVPVPAGRVRLVAGNSAFLMS